VFRRPLHGVLPCAFELESKPRPASHGKDVGTITGPARCGGCRASKSPSRTRRRTVATGTTSDKSGFYQALTPAHPAPTRLSPHEGFRPLEVITAPLEINQSFRATEAGSGAANEQVFGGIAGCGVETVIRRWVSRVTSRPIVNMPLKRRNVLGPRSSATGCYRGQSGRYEPGSWLGRASASAVDVRIR